MNTDQAQDNTELVMALTKSTKRTHVYTCDKENAPITTLYIQKHALPPAPPVSMQIIINSNRIIIDV